ncbi:hypothetical protein K8R04_02700 [Candidatus Uhrbacteria bacterium]|nr:hypothetical protein [Candidatus Uhrbacteria bacterium]
MALSPFSYGGFMPALDDVRSDDHFTTSSPDGHLSVAEMFLIGIVTAGSLLWSLLMAILRLPFLILDGLLAIARS